MAGTSAIIEAAQLRQIDFRWKLTSRVFADGPAVIGGKPMLAGRLPGMLPPLDTAEASGIR